MLSLFLVGKDDPRPLRQEQHKVLPIFELKSEYGHRVQMQPSEGLGCNTPGLDMPYGAGSVGDHSTLQLEKQDTVVRDLLRVSLQTPSQSAFTSTMLI